MRFESAVAGAELILAEGSMYERLRRHDGVVNDPEIAYSSLIYDDAFADVVAAVHAEYIDVAADAGLAMLVGCATWRANRERIARSGFAGERVNQDNIAFARALCERRDDVRLYVGAGLGPKGNAYDPAEALGVDEAQRFHSYQVDAIAQAGPDVVLGMTLPALSEARGIAQGLEASGLPYMLSFVIRDSGRLLDGTPLVEAMDVIDQERARPPLGYSINCVHPSVLATALAAAPTSVAARLKGFRANTADEDPEEIDGSAQLIGEDPDVLAGLIGSIHAAHPLSIIGGCCGTGTEHIAAIARIAGRSSPAG